MWHFMYTAIAISPAVQLFRWGEWKGTHERIATLTYRPTRNELTRTTVPLNEIRHCCFGTVAGYSADRMHIFFLELHLESQYKHANFFGEQDQQLWLDAVLLPALNAMMPAGRMKYYPHSEALLQRTFLRQQSRPCKRQTVCENRLCPTFCEQNISTGFDCTFLWRWMDWHCVCIALLWSLVVVLTFKMSR